MKKVIKVLLIMSMCIGLSGCGGSTDYSKQVKDIEDRGFKVSSENTINEKNFRQDIVWFDKNDQFDDDFITLNIVFKDGKATNALIMAGIDWSKSRFNSYLIEDGKIISDESSETSGDMNILEEVLDEIGQTNSDLVSIARWYYDRNIPDLKE